VNARARLFLALTCSTLLIVGLASLTTAALATWRADDPQPTMGVGAARVDRDVALVVVAQQGAGDVAAQARADALRWMLAAVALTVVPAMAVAWFASGRMRRTVDRALADVDAKETAKEEERRRRLDEVIHELRTPLAVAGTNLELAASDPTIGPETGRLVDAARRAADRMRRTVDDLAEHGRLAVTRADVLDLAAEARAVVADHAGPARARGLHLQVGGASVVGWPAGDRAAVRTALGNLTSNAVRLAPSGSSIVVSCGELGAWAWVAVTDEGPGLPLRFHERVFERGWRGRHDRDRDRSPDSARRGLGLTITRQLTEAQGGLITLESEEGAGSTFTIWLPLTDDAADTDVMTADRLHPAVRPWRDLVASIPG
jgi:signal transduction histidine kinase